VTGDALADPAEVAVPDDVAGLVRTAARAAGGKPALVEGTRSLSWAELDVQVDRAAAVFAGLGLPSGAPVALALTNGLEFPVAYFGVLRAGLVVLPVNPEYTPREFTHVLGDSGAALVVAGPTAEDALQHALTELADPPRLLTLLSFAELVAAVEAPRQVEPPTGGEDLAVLLYTSGTSGRPRGAMLSHRALLADLEHVGRIEPPPTRADDVVLLVLPLFHIFGLNTGLGMLAATGATGIVVDRFDPATTAELVRRHRVTNLVGAPPMYLAWSLLPDAEQAFTSVRLAVSGAAPLPPDVLRRFRSRTGLLVHEGYGLTETSPSVTSTLCSFDPKPGSVGRPVPGVEVSRVDGSGSEVDPDDPGEIRVRGANLFSGYWPDGREAPDAEGWWRTGDVAVADDAGDLTLVDRRRDLILVSGFNVYPREVESVLALHPDVEEVAVLGIPHPYSGSAVKALVVPRSGADGRPVALSAEPLLVHAARYLARFKCPTAIEIVDSLPHTATGKVAKGRLRDEPGEPS
jgi:long-chain acyl-CoA synthetase